MDYKAIINLMNEMNHTDLTKVEVEEEGLRICLEKAASGTTVAAVQANVPQVNVNAPAPSTVIQSPVFLANQTAEKPQEEISGKKILAPMVGTFFTQPSPELPPFVKVGDKVKKGQTICIIEAMKLMNEIESEYDGEIVKVLMNNEEMVEFGQPMFVIQ